MAIARDTRVLEVSKPRFGLARLLDWASWIAVAVALAYTAIFLVIAFLRIGYPYELEWLEGSMAEHTHRVLHGLPLYAAPSLEFVAAIYTPLYYQVSALLASILGIGFLPLRLVSLLSTVGAFGLIYLFVQRETGKIRPAIAAAGLFAAAYGATGFFFDMARVDSFALFLLLWGAYAVYRIESVRDSLVAAVILAAGFFAKQSAVPLIMFMTLFVAWRLRFRSVHFFVVLAVLTVGGSLWLNRLSDGWFLYYVYDLPTQTAIDRRFIHVFWSHDLQGGVPVLCLACGLYLTALIRSCRYAALLFAVCLLAGLGSAAFLARIHVGGHINTLMPVYAAMAITTGLLIGNADSLKFPFGIPTGVVRLFGYLALIVQMTAFAYNPIEPVPSDDMKIAGGSFVQTLARFPGDVYAPCHGFLPGLADRNDVAHQQAINDVALGDPRMAAQVNEQLLRDIRTARFSLLVLNHEWVSPVLDSYYCAIQSPLGDSVVYQAWIEGEKFRPRYWYVRLSDSLPAALPAAPISVRD